MFAQVGLPSVMLHVLSSGWYGSATFLSFYDWKHKQAPIVALAFSFICAKGSSRHPIDLPWLIFISFSVLCSFFLVYKKLMGSGDIIFLLATFTRLSVKDLPLFFFLSGLFGIMTFFIRKSKELPFIPAMFLSSLICELCAGS